MSGHRYADERGRAAMRAAGLLLVTLGVGCTLVLGINGEFSEASSSGSAGSTGGGSSSSTSASSGSGGSGGAGAHGPITGKQLAYQIDLDGSTLDDKATDFSVAGSTPQAFVYDDAKKTFSAPYTAKGDATGNFTIDGVPDGPYLLAFGKTAYWLTNRDLLDFSTYQTHILTYTPVAMTAQVALDVTNVTAWQAGDILELIDPKSSAYAYDQGSGVLMPIWSTGFTTIAASGPWVKWVSGVDVPVQASSTVSLFHTGTRPNHSYMTLLDYATVSFATTNGPMPFNVTAAFAPFDHASQNFQLDVDVPAFEAAVPKTNPRAAPDTTGIDYQAHPAPLDHGQLMGAADLAYETWLAPSGPKNQTYVFGNPFVGWSLFVTITTDFTLSVQIPGTTAHLIQGFVGIPPVRCDLAPDDPMLKPTAAFAPPDVPAQNPRIDGTSLFNPGQSIDIASLTPTITWDSSTTPHQLWEVRIIPVGIDGTGATKVQFLQSSRVRTRGDATSIVVPPGYMQPASHYLIVIGGASLSATDYEATPSGSAFPRCVTNVIGDLVNTP